MNNFGVDRDFGVILCFRLFGPFLFMNDIFMNFFILGDSIDLPRCMNF